MEGFMTNLDVCNHYCKSVGKDISGKTVVGQNMNSKNGKRQNRLNIFQE